MIETIKNVILYGGISRTDYLSISAEIYKSNIKNVLVFSALASIAYTILYIQVSFDAIMSVMKTIYGISVFSYFGLLLVTLFFTKIKVKFKLAPYLGILIPLVLGAIIGIYVNGKAQTTTFMVFLFAIPLLFTIRPIFSLVVIFLADFMYIILVITQQADNPVLKANNLSNAIIFGVVSVIFSSYMMNLKIKAINNARNYKFLMENDQLTGLNNRLSFNSLLDQIKNYRENCTIIEFDINGLKEANDTKGHIAGDEIIVGAAACIKSTFGKYGNCFRIGGDEFVAVLDKPYKDEKQLLADFEENCRNWKGRYNDELSISYGLVNLANHQNNTLEEILAKADTLMYKNKSDYYAKTGKERRKR